MAKNRPMADEIKAINENSTTLIPIVFLFDYITRYLIA